MPRGVRNNGTPALDARTIASTVVQEVFQEFYRQGQPLPIATMQSILAAVERKVESLTAATSNNQD